MTGLSTTYACTKGDLPDRSPYDIHCPVMGGPDYKFNYLASSCRSRQLSGGCKEKGCERFNQRVNPLGASQQIIRNTAGHSSPANEGTSPDPDVTVGETTQTKQEVVVAESHKKKAECADCAKVRTICARGLCGVCYQRHKKSGTLDSLFPAKLSGGRMGPRKKTDSKPNPVREVVAANESPFFNATVEFDGADIENIWIPLNEWAEQERRTVPAQILFILDNIIAERQKDQAHV